MEDFFFNYKNELGYTLIIIIVLLVVQYVLKKTANRVGKRQDMNIARTRLMFRYINFLMLFIAIFLLMIAWGFKFRELALVFSSVFAVIGIGLFAIWSILSNVTSGVIMFFSFPYKIGDKIRIHDDKDESLEGIIEDIKVFHLHLRTMEGELITYPNNLILQKAVSLIEKNARIDEGKDAL
ncbi:MAG TPA: mechanosensitive ion channel domain-containing protein [Flavobacteriaceae bacterium]|nr:mechanosensitive ion channel domain-containing protein [Flavobacteriaceae bacterium]